MPPVPPVHQQRLIETNFVFVHYLTCYFVAAVLILQWCTTVELLFEKHRNLSFVLFFPWECKTIVVFMRNPVVLFRDFFIYRLLSLFLQDYENETERFKAILDLEDGLVPQTYKKSRLESPALRVKAEVRHNYQFYLSLRVPFSLCIAPSYVCPGQRACGTVETGLNWIWRNTLSQGVVGSQVYNRSCQ